MPGLGRPKKDGTCGAWTVVGGLSGATHYGLPTPESRVRWPRLAGFEVTTEAQDYCVCSGIDSRSSF